MAETDVLIIGGGLMGAAVARGLREADPDTRILLVDAGSVIGSVNGLHLHDVSEPHIWERYNERVASGIQGFYTGTPPTSSVGDSLVGAEPGMYHLTSIGHDAGEMPGAAVAFNSGGMGVHWTAATPTPWGDEVPGFLDDRQWRADLEQATRLLDVRPAPFPATRAGKAATAAIGEVFRETSAPGRGIQVMPMAVRPDRTGVNRRTGPNVIFPPLADDRLDPRFTLRTGSQALRLLHAGGRVRGATVRDDTGATRDVHAAVTVVCADAVRTPQLLFASGIRPPALGRYLNEHAMLSGRVLADPDRLGFTLAELSPQADDEMMVEHYWLPHSGPDQPFQFQIVNQVFSDERRTPLAYAVGLGMYVPTEIRAENRLDFAEAETDAAGMPRISVRFSYSERDKELIERAREVQRRVARELGRFDPDTESALLPAGSSLHFTGTVRMGTDDATSVCDPRCRVWGFDNLYVAGNGVIPTALACNSTLAGMTSAVRAARSISRKETAWH